MQMVLFHREFGSRGTCQNEMESCVVIDLGKKGSGKGGSKIPLEVKSKCLKNSGVLEKQVKAVQ